MKSTNPPSAKPRRSTPATYIKVFDEIRALFANLPAAKMRGYTASRFSFNTEGGRCEACGGNGLIKHEMAFLPTSHVVCTECHGQRYNAPTLEIDYQRQKHRRRHEPDHRRSRRLLRRPPKIARTLNLLADTGTGYLKLGQPSPTLSGGEAQRLKLVAELSRGIARTANERIRKNRQPKGNLYLIEEPTIGLHPTDVAKLIDVLHRLVDDGHTVIVIEHNLDVIAEADHVLDIGPEAGARRRRNHRPRHPRTNRHPPHQPHRPLPSRRPQTRRLRKSIKAIHLLLNPSAQRKPTKKAKPVEGILQPSNS